MFTMCSRYVAGGVILPLAIVLLGGCTKTEEANKASNSTASAPAPQSPAKPSASTAVSPAAASSAPAIAEADGETPGTKVEVQELKRSSNSLMLKIVIVNDSDKPLDFGYHFGDKANEIKDFATVGGITLVDAVGKKKYFVVRDTENACVCSSNLKDLAPKGRMNLWAKFPPPPDDVQKISVVIPHFTPMDDVPIGH